MNAKKVHRNEGQKDYKPVIDSTSNERGGNSSSYECKNQSSREGLEITVVLFYH
jgi:hypothetical protein